MGIFAFKIFKSFGGRSNRGAWSNLYNIVSDLAIDHPSLRETAEYIVGAEKLAHYDAVHFMRCHIKQVAENYTNRPANRFVTIELDGTGARALNQDLLPPQICVEIKRDAVEGRSGAMLLRGCLTANDVQSSNDASYVLATPQIFSGGSALSDSFLTRLNGDLPEGRFVMPNPPAITVQTSRDVVRHRLGGVAIVQTTKRRRSISSDRVRVAQRQLDDARARLLRLAGDGLVSGISGNRLATAWTIVQGALEVVEALPALEAAGIDLWPGFGQLPALPGG